VATQQQKQPIDPWGGMLGAGLTFFGTEYDRRKQQQALQNDPFNRAAGGMLSQAMAFDPNATAQNLMGQEMALRQPYEDAGRLALMRNLQSKGLMGLSSYDPGKSGVSTEGGPVNPLAAAYFAAEQRGRGEAAQRSQGAADARLNSLYNRAGMLSQTGGQRAAARPQSNIGSLLSGASEVLKQPGVLGGIASGVQGLLGGATDWLRRLGGGTDYSVFSNPWGDE
jgi:adhesin HecA-like repeat protein